MNLLRKPSCGAPALSAAAGAALPIADRCAIPASLHPPQAALRRRCPARGFGVDVETAHRERRRGGVAHPFPQVPERAVLVWCCEVFWQAKAAVKSPL